MHAGDGAPDLTALAPGDRWVGRMGCDQGSAAGKDGQDLGGTAIIAPEDGFVLAGRRWAVVDVDIAKRTIQVVPGRGRQHIAFNSSGIALHPRVVARMRDILAGRHDVSLLLDAAGARALKCAQAAYGHLNLDHTTITGQERAAVWTWLGGAANRALADLLCASGSHGDPFGVGVDLSGCGGDPACALRQAASCSDGALRAWLGEIALPIPGKYDHLVPIDDLVDQYIQRDIDVPAARAWLATQGA